jgi:hypothetical protein
MSCNIFDSTVQDCADLGGMCALALFEVLFTVRWRSLAWGWGWRWSAWSTLARGSPAGSCLEDASELVGETRGWPSSFARQPRRARGTNVHPESGVCAPIYPHRHQCAPLDGAGAVPAEQSRQHLGQCRRNLPPFPCAGPRERRAVEGAVYPRERHSGCGRCRRGDLAAGVRRQPLVLADAHEERSRGWAAAGALPSCVVDWWGRLPPNSP